MIRYYDFGDSLAFSKTANRIFVPLLCRYVPKIKNIAFTSVSRDDEGIDCSITKDTGDIIRVDLKLRRQDFGKNDVALETWSVCHTKVGWTRDFTKKTDYILWYWKDSHKHYWVAFPPLRQLFNKYWQVWTYRKEMQDSGGWLSECMFVPIAVIEREIAVPTSPKIPLERTQILEIWQRSGRPAIPLRQGEICRDLEKFLSCSNIRDSDAQALRAWAQNKEPL